MASISLNRNTVNRFYVYQYIRKDGSPYYIGKGTGRRAWSSNGKTVRVPNDNTQIQIVKAELSESDAFNLEIKLIERYGRKDLGTGILRNLTAGGEGTSGYIYSTETRAKMSKNRKGKGMRNTNSPSSHSIETREKLKILNGGENNGMYGKVHNDVSLQIMSEKKTGKNNPMYGYEFPIQICPHCNKEGKNMKRWHFDNCRSKKKNTT